MRQRDNRERLLAAKLRRIAEELNIDSDALIERCRHYGVFRDARESGDEFYITINRIPTEGEMQDMIQATLTALAKRID